MNSWVASFTAASTYPVKLLQNAGVVNPCGHVLPYHLQLYPTNRCNLNCAFCSCSERDKRQELSIQEITKILAAFQRLGTRACTITGGGEPLLHSHFNDILVAAEFNHIKVGLVTNGTVIDRLDSHYPTWIRISLSDGRLLDDAYYDAVGRACSRYTSDWSFSYVLTAEPDYDKLRRAVTFAAAHNFTHVRIVADLFDTDCVPDMGAVRGEIGDIPGADLIIYQGRKDATRGRERCWMSLMKPTIAADGRVWPCCGAQYAINNETHGLPESMCMGSWEEYATRVRKQDYFRGDICDRCYYNAMNDVLEQMVLPLKHVEFV